MTSVTKLTPDMSNHDALLALLNSSHERINRMLAERLTLQRQLDTLLRATKQAIDLGETYPQIKANPVFAELVQALQDVIDNRVPNEGEDSIAQRLFAAHEPYGLLIDQPQEEQEYWKRVARQIAPRINRLGRDAIDLGLRRWAERQDVSLVINQERIADARDDIIRAQEEADHGIFCVQDPVDLGMLSLALSDQAAKLRARIERGGNDPIGVDLDEQALGRVEKLRGRLTIVSPSEDSVKLPGSTASD